MTFQEKLLLTPGDKTAKLAKPSDATVQKNISISQLLRGRRGVQPLETDQKDNTNEGISLDLDKVNYARPLKVKVERFFKGALMHVL
jgi:hypothetical protein